MTETRTPPMTGAGTDELAPAYAELLAALDRMLTTGSYYPPGHAQYQAVADQCAEAVEAALQGKRSCEIEVTKEGLVLGGVTVAKTDQRAARLHELLEPLNQALLEIHAGLTAEDLHEGLSVLKQHRKDLGTTTDYQEVVIEGMPDTLTATDRALFVRTRGGNGPERTDSPLNKHFDPNTIPDAALVPTPEGQMMEREFLAVIQGLMKTGTSDRLRDLRQAADPEVPELLGTWVPDQAVSVMHQVLKSLEETNSDPMMLPHLVDHAQAALKLTGNAELVHLVFERLRKTNLAKPRKQRLLENRPKPSRKPVRFTLSRAELRKLIGEVHDDAEELIAAWREKRDLIAPANADCMGICLQILHVAPTDELADGIADAMRQILTAEELDEDALQVATDALVAVFAADDAETTDLVATMVTAPLREAHITRLGPLWLEVWRRMGGTRERERVWPHLVNDLIMGLKWEDPAQKIAFCQEVSSVETHGRVDLLTRLEAMQALQEKVLAKNAFHAPAPLLYNVHQLLLGSSLAEQHGPLLHKRLLHQRAHPLAVILMDGLVEYSHERRALYDAILSQGVAGPIVPELADIATRHLKGTIKRLPPERRDEKWVPEAITWLGRLGGASAENVLKRIRNEKKFLFIPVWPGPCRAAARAALAGEVAPERTRRG